MLGKNKADLEIKTQNYVSPKGDSYLVAKDGNLKMSWNKNKEQLKLNNLSDHIFVFDPRPVKMLSDYNNLSNKTNYFKQLNQQEFAEVMMLVNDIKFKCFGIIENIEGFFADARDSFQYIKHNSKNTEFLYKADLIGSTKILNQNDLYTELYKIMGKTYPIKPDELNRHLDENSKSMERIQSREFESYDKSFKSINAFSINNLKKSLSQNTLYKNFKDATTGSGNLKNMTNSKVLVDLSQNKNFTIKESDLFMKRPNVSHKYNETGEISSFNIYDKQMKSYEERFSLAGIDPTHYKQSFNSMRDSSPQCPQAIETSLSKFEKSPEHFTKNPKRSPMVMKSKMENPETLLERYGVHNSQERIKRPNLNKTRSYLPNFNTKTSRAKDFAFLKDKQKSIDRINPKTYSIMKYEQNSLSETGNNIFQKTTNQVKQNKGEKMTIADNLRNSMKIKQSTTGNFNPNMFTSTSENKLKGNRIFFDPFHEMQDMQNDIHKASL